MRGVKRWPKKSIQRFADHIRKFGLDETFLVNTGYQGQGEKKYSCFCTRERFFQYFTDVVNKRGEFFSEMDVESILTDLDPFYTGIIQVKLI